MDPGMVEQPFSKGLVPCVQHGSCLAAGWLRIHVLVDECTAHRHAETSFHGDVGEYGARRRG